MNPPSKIPEEARKRMETLSQILRQANEAYYRHGHSPMSDAEFDFQLKELEKLEELHPDLKMPDSPTHRVGSDLSAGFRKVAHVFPMLSIQNTYSEEEVRDFHRQVTEKIPEAGLDKVYQILRQKTSP